MIVLLAVLFDVNAFELGVEVPVFDVVCTCAQPGGALEGDTEADGEIDGLPEAEGDTLGDTDGDTLGDIEAEGEGDGDVEAEGETLDASYVT